MLHVGLRSFPRPPAVGRLLRLSAGGCRACQQGLFELRHDELADEVEGAIVRAMSGRLRSRRGRGFPVLAGRRARCHLSA